MGVMNNMIKNVVFFSNGSGSGKSSIILALIKVLRDKGYDIIPFKSIAITHDLIKIDNRSVPWSLYAQLYSAQVPYDSNLNPIMLVPELETDEQDCFISSHTYKLYLSGIYQKEIQGEKFLKDIIYYKDLLAKLTFNFLKKKCLFIEGMGNAFEDSSNIVAIANYSIFQTDKFKHILVFDISKEKALNKLEESFQLAKDKNIAIDALIITKYKEKNYLLKNACEIAKFYSIPVIGMIPYKEDALCREIVHFTNWTNFIKNYIDMHWFENNGEGK